MVEIFIKRGELLPSDESVEQHKTKHAEEIADVDKDRNGPGGLFKGMFPAAKRELIFDEGDGVYRCPRCLAEHEGGSTCSNCDLAVETGIDFSDMEDDFDAEDLENLELDLDDDFEAGFDHTGPAYFGGPHPLHRHVHAHVHQFYHPHHHHHYHPEDDSENSESDSDLDGDEDNDDEDNSLNDFVVADDTGELAEVQANAREPSNTSDDESDEGEVISRRRRRPVITNSSRSSSPSVPQADSLNSMNGPSEDNEVMLQRAGWSPLEQESESDLEGSHHHPSYASGDENSNGSDTETIGNGASDEGSNLSGTPRVQGYEHYPSGSIDGDGSEDHDGDTEMSVSLDGYDYETGLDEPHSRSANLPYQDVFYGYEDASSRSVSVTSDAHVRGVQDLGESRSINDVDEESSDDSIVAPPRRRRRPASIQPQQPHYDPRISTIFAEHQQIRAHNDHSNLVALEEMRRAQAPVVEPASRTRRMTFYRNQPQRRIDPLRSSRSPSATRIFHSSSTAGRLPRIYSRRN